MQEMCKTGDDSIFATGEVRYNAVSDKIISTRAVNISSRSSISSSNYPPQWSTQEQDMEHSLDFH